MNEILTSLDRPVDSIVALAEFAGGTVVGQACQVASSKDAIRRNEDAIPTQFDPEMLDKQGMNQEGKNAIRVMVLSHKTPVIHVKGRIAGAGTITVTRNEILTSLSKPDDYILAIVEFLDADRHRIHYVRRPFQREPDFGVTSVDYDLQQLLARAEVPRWAGR
jgi:hypothetical protein